MSIHRNERIILLERLGVNRTLISKKFGLSRARVNQILKDSGSKKDLAEKLLNNDELAFRISKIIEFN